VDEARPALRDVQYAEKLAARERGDRAPAARRRQPPMLLPLGQALYIRGAGRSAA